ncbi:MAG: restriction endonuclease subunit S [Sediminibacterium sp.]
MSKTALKNLCKPNQIGKYGIPASAEDFDQSKVRYLRISDIDDFGNLLNNDKKSVSSPDIDKYILEEGDLVVARTGNSTGRTYYHENKNGILAFAGFLIKYGLDSSKVNPKYLKYYTISNEYKEWVKNLSVGSTRGNINAQTFADCPISLPNREQQDVLVKVLSALDSKIELNKRINAELESMAKTIYDYWFVQFDFPDKNGKPYKSSGGKMVWNEELKREIPEGWEVNTLSYWINNDKSGDWGKEEREGNYSERVFCIRGADLNGLNGKGEVKAPERYILEKNSHKILDPHDLIVEISGGSPTQSTGRMAYMTKESLERFDAPVICSNFCKAVTLKDKKSLYNFAFEWNKAYDHGVLFGYEGKTSGIKNLLFESFVTSYYTTIPSNHFMEKFYDFMTPLEIRKQKNLLENQKLTELRDWLLPMLMNGQVRVN